jgi:hypothetical protein
MTVHGIQSLNTELPLVEDDTGARIPLQLVFVDRTQPLGRYGHLNDHILKIARHFMAPEHNGFSSIDALGKSFVDAIPKISSSSVRQNGNGFLREH